MSQFTDYGENQIADYIRGEGITLPANWYLAPLSAASDSSVTEITGLGLSRFSMARSLANWSGTQGPGTTIASVGSSHATSNNIAVPLGTASGTGSLVAIGLFDASVAGNCWMVWRLETPLSFGAADVIEFAAAAIKFTVGLAGGVSNYLSNKIIDLLFRAQSYSFPATLWHALYVTPPSNAGGGSEVGGGVGYARASLVCSLTNVCGTHGAGTTDVSSGTSGRIANNIAVTHPAPTGPWGVCTHGGWKDSSSGGELLFWRELDAPITPTLGSPAPSYAADQFEIIIA